MRIPDNIRKCVAFIGFVDQLSGEFSPRGSVFFVGSNTPEGETARLYAVTAKHVIDELSRRGVAAAAIRFNTKGDNPSSGVHEIKLADWAFHPSDSSVDVAICPISFTTAIDHLALPQHLFLTPEIIDEDEVALGDEVFMIGLFRHHVGRAQNIPIVRTGNLAALDEERVSTRMGDMNAYLIEARSIGGLSGSPVILNLGQVRFIDGEMHHRVGEQPAFYFLGMVHGHYDVSEDMVDENVSVSTEKINTGIAIVTPYYKVVEVMEAYEAK